MYKSVNMSYNISTVTKANSMTRKGKHAAKMYPDDDNEPPLSLQKKESGKRKNC